MAMTIWDQILAHVRRTIPEEDFRRWFGSTAYASDSGDQITVWVPSEAIRRHVKTHYDDSLRSALTVIGRPYTEVRFVVGGTDDEDEEEDL